ncbi:rhomboid family intramembrane serine protease [bacterium]|nr:rhomboid family intramembrane serine protease [bacterium]
MLFPYKDDNPTKSFPFVTIIFIGINVVCFLLTGLAGSNEFVRHLYTYGLIPAELFHGQIINTIPPELIEQGHHMPEVGNLPTFATLFTHMFMHGGLAHLIGNIWFLWLFGDNIEDRMGPLKYIFFYLIAGLVAALCHGLTGTSSVIPMIGASGAISGVIGAYIILYPYARIHTIFFIFVFFYNIKLPAFIFLGLWFIGQVFWGFATLGAEGAGVAFFAHIGGFVAGVLMVKLFIRRKYVRVKGKDGKYYNREVTNYPGNKYMDY